MKRTLLASLAATVPVAALAIGSAMAQPPKATANTIVSYASVENPGVHPNDTNIHLFLPLVITVHTTKSSGMLAATPREAANSLDS